MFISIQCIPDVDSRAEGKATPLHYAARYRPRKRATDEETDNGALYINQEGVNERL